MNKVYETSPDILQKLKKIENELLLKFNSILEEKDKQLQSTFKNLQKYNKLCSKLQTEFTTQDKTRIYERIIKIVKKMFYDYTNIVINYLMKLYLRFLNLKKNLLKMIVVPLKKLKTILSELKIILLAKEIIKFSSNAKVIIYDLHISFFNSLARTFELLNQNVINKISTSYQDKIEEYSSQNNSISDYNSESISPDEPVYQSEPVSPPDLESKDKPVSTPDSESKDEPVSPPDLESKDKPVSTSELEFKTKLESKDKEVSSKDKEVSSQDEQESKDQELSSQAQLESKDEAKPISEAKTLSTYNNTQDKFIIEPTIELKSNTKEKETSKVDNELLQNESIDLKEQLTSPEVKPKLESDTPEFRKGGKGKKYKKKTKKNKKRKNRTKKFY